MLDEWQSTAAGVAGALCMIVAIVSFAVCCGCSCNSRACRKARRAVRLWPRRVKRGTWFTIKWTLLGIAAFFLLRVGMRLMSWSMAHGPPPTSPNPYYRPPVTLPPPYVPPYVPPAETRFAVAHDHKPQTKKPRKRAQRA